MSRPVGARRLPFAPALLALTAAAAMLAAPGAPAGAAVPDGAAYQELYFPMADGTQLHADVLRDADVPWGVVQPVIMTVSPYVNHSGTQLELDPLGGGAPNERFHDFLALTGALEDGYTYILVDLPGFGGSGGCNDWGGLREQGAVHAAVEWAAHVDFADGSSQPTVRQPVGLIGKSYDGWTGLMGMAQDQTAGGVEGLAAVVAMEPVYSGYRYLFHEGVPLPNAGATGTVGNFQQYDAKPGALNDDPEYHTTALLGGTPVTCYAENMAGAENDRADAPYWVERDLVPLVRGSDVPLFLTQGFLETNTRQDAALDLWNALDHGHGGNRAWFGQFDHVRGWDRVGGPLGDGEPETGRQDFVAQLEAFFAEHLKGEAPDEVLPAVEVQSNLGGYRGEAAYPPADVLDLTTDIGALAFTDVTNNGDGAGSGRGAWAVSQPLDGDVHMAGEPRFEAQLGTVPAGLDLAVNVYDVDEAAGTATLVSRATTLVRTAGAQPIDLQLYSQDWVFAEGHRVGILLSGGNEDWWDHSSTNAAVTAGDATITLPFLAAPREDDIASEGTSPRLRAHLAGGTVPIAQVDLDREVHLVTPGPSVARR